ncbi:MAG: glycosyltransferase family 2 protein [Prevotella sp.]|nr:glycosyltransferase family 2 protein [Prevotella sp.]
MKASIIIPVYNKEKYVEKCLRSALNQTFDDFEVIAVDDESTDQSGAICDRLAQEDTRLRVFHITNRRVTGARLYGVQQAQGDYVMFLDSDDELLPNALSATYPVIVREQADEVFGTYRDQHGKYYVSPHEGLVSNTDGLIMEICNRTARFSFAWAVLYRKEILKGCLKQEMGHMYAEDKLMQMKVLMKQPKAYFIRDCIYLYNADIPNSWKSFNLAKDIEFEEELQRVFQPRWDKLQSAYTMHRIKMYERYLENRDFVSCKHYQDLRHVKDASLSLPSRITIALPPQISWLLVWGYRKYRRLTHKS